MREFRAVRAGEVQSAESTDEHRSVVYQSYKTWGCRRCDGGMAVGGLWQVRGRHPLYVAYFAKSGFHLKTHNIN